MSESNSRSPITTHILDTSLGMPAAGVPVKLFCLEPGNAGLVGEGVTDADGRVMTGLVGDKDFRPGQYRIEFETDVYFSSKATDAFYPHVSIAFIVSPGEPHYHVPLLLSPFGYSTYRGS